MAELSDKLDARDRVSLTLRSTAVPITITTISYCVTFAVGAASEFKAMKIFSLYTGTYNRFFFYYSELNNRLPI